MRRNASPSAWEEAVQAVLMPIIGPRASAKRASSALATFWLMTTVREGGER